MTYLTKHDQIEFIDLFNRFGDEMGCSKDCEACKYSVLRASEYRMCPLIAAKEMVSDKFTEPALFKLLSSARVS